MILAEWTVVAERILDGTDKVGFVERLLQHDCIRSARMNSRAAHEHVRNGSGAQYLLDGRDATPVAQMRIHDHQIRPVLQGSRYRIGLGRLDGAYLVAHPCERLGKQHAENGVVLHYEDAERFHRFTSPPVLPQLTRRRECPAPMGRGPPVACALVRRPCWSAPAAAPGAPRPPPSTRQGSAPSPACRPRERRTPNPAPSSSGRRSPRASPRPGTAPRP